MEGVKELAVVDVEGGGDVSGHRSLVEGELVVALHLRKAHAPVCREKRPNTSI